MMIYWAWEAMFDRADGQHEVDRWHDQHAEFYFALSTKQDSFYD